MTDSAMMAGEAESPRVESLPRPRALWIERPLIEDLAILYRQRRIAWQLFLANVAEGRRHSGLGLLAPFFSVFLHVVLLGSVMTLVFHEAPEVFLPFFAVSYSVWQAMNTVIGHHASANERAARFLMFPNLSGQILHLMDFADFTVSFALKLFAAFVVIAVVDAAIIPQVNVPALLAGIVLLAAALFSWALPMAHLFDRIRLLRAFLPQFLYAAFLITPILWRPERLQDHQWVALYNPIYHVIEVVRAPILDGTWPFLSWAITGAVILAGAIATAVFYRPNRNLMIFRWVA